MRRVKGVEERNEGGKGVNFEEEKKDDKEMRRRKEKRVGRAWVNPSGSRQRCPRSQKPYIS